jgi:hypothetical protein
VVGVDGGTTTTSCAADGLVVLYSAPDPAEGGFVTTLTVDTTSVYWTTVTSTLTGIDVMKASLCGGTATTLASGQSMNPSLLAVGSTDVYWVTLEGGADGPGQVMQVPLEGGTPTALATKVLPTALALDAANLYWTDEATGTVMKVPLAGGTPVPLVGSGTSGGFGSVAVDATDAYWWANQYGLRKVPLAGGDVTTLVPDTVPIGDFWHFVLSGENLYFGADLGPYALLTVPVTGGAPTVLASGPDVVGSLAVDGTSAYWLSSSACMPGSCTGLVMKVPLGGGTPVPIASGWPVSTDGLGGITVDATSVYWTTGNTVMKVTPK